MKITVRTQPKIRVSIGGAESVGVGIPPTQVIAQNLYPDYEGRYTVTPDVEAVTLPTKDTIMRDDVTVFKIPLWEVSNPVGGTTIYIGGEEIYGN